MRPHLLGTLFSGMVIINPYLLDRRLIAHNTILCKVEVVHSLCRARLAGATADGVSLYVGGLQGLIALSL